MSSDTGCWSFGRINNHPPVQSRDESGQPGGPRTRNLLYITQNSALACLKRLQRYQAQQRRAAESIYIVLVSLMYYITLYSHTFTTPKHLLKQPYYIGKRWKAYYYSKRRWFRTFMFMILSIWFILTSPVKIENPRLRRLNFWNGIAYTHKPPQGRQQRWVKKESIASRDKGPNKSDSNNVPLVVDKDTPNPMNSCFMKTLHDIYGNVMLTNGKPALIEAVCQMKPTLIAKSHKKTCELGTSYGYGMIDIICLTSIFNFLMKRPKEIHFVKYSRNRMWHLLTFEKSSLRVDLPIKTNDTVMLFCEEVDDLISQMEKMPKIAESHIFAFTYTPSWMEFFEQQELVIEPPVNSYNVLIDVPETIESRMNAIKSWNKKYLKNYTCLIADFKSVLDKIQMATLDKSWSQPVHQSKEAAPLLKNKGKEPMEQELVKEESFDSIPDLDVETDNELQKLIIQEIASSEQKSEEEFTDLRTCKEKWQDALQRFLELPGNIQDEIIYYLNKNNFELPHTSFPTWDQEELEDLSDTFRSIYAPVVTASPVEHIIGLATLDDNGNIINLGTIEPEMEMEFDWPHMGDMKHIEDMLVKYSAPRRPALTLPSDVTIEITQAITDGNASVLKSPNVTPIELPTPSSSSSSTGSSELRSSPPCGVKKVTISPTVPSTGAPHTTAKRNQDDIVEEKSKIFDPREFEQVKNNQKTNYASRSSVVMVDCENRDWYNENKITKVECQLAVKQTAIVPNKIVTYQTAKFNSSNLDNASYHLLDEQQPKIVAHSGPMMRVLTAITFFYQTIRLPNWAANTLTKIINPLRLIMIRHDLPNPTAIAFMTATVGKIAIQVSTHVSHKDGLCHRVRAHGLVDQILYNRAMTDSIQFQHRAGISYFKIFINYMLRWFLPHWFTNDASLVTTYEFNLGLRRRPCEDYQEHATPALKFFIKSTRRLLIVKYCYYFYYCAYWVASNDRWKNKKEMSTFELSSIVQDAVTTIHDTIVEIYLLPTIMVASHSVFYFFNLAIRATYMVLTTLTIPFSASRDPHEFLLKVLIIYFSMGLSISLTLYLLVRYQSYYLPSRHLPNLFFYGCGPCNPSDAFMMQVTTGKEVFVAIPHALPPLVAGSVCSRRSLADGVPTNHPGLVLVDPPNSLPEGDDCTYYWSQVGNYVDPISGVIVAVVSPVKSQGNHLIEAYNQIEAAMILSGLPPMVTIQLLNPVTGLIESHYQVIYYDVTLALNIPVFFLCTKYNEKLNLLARVASSPVIRPGSVDLDADIKFFTTKYKNLRRTCAIDMCNEYNGQAASVVEQYLQVSIEQILITDHNFNQLRFIRDPFHAIRTREDVSPKHFDEWLYSRHENISHPLIAFTRNYGVGHVEKLEAYYDNQVEGFSRRRKRGGKRKPKGKALYYSESDRRQYISEGILANVGWTCNSCGGSAPKSFRWIWQMCPDCYTEMMENERQEDDYYDPENPISYPDGVYHMGAPQQIKPVLPKWKTKPVVPNFATCVRLSRNRTDNAPPLLNRDGPELVGVGSNVRVTCFGKLAPGSTIVNRNAPTELNMIANRIFKNPTNTAAPNAWNQAKQVIYDPKSYLMKRIKELAVNGDNINVIPYRLSDPLSTQHAIEQNWITAQEAEEIERYMDDFDAHNYAGGDRAQYREEEQPPTYPHNRYQDGRGWIHAFEPSRQREIWEDLADFNKTGFTRQMLKCKIFMKREKSPLCSSYLAARCRSNPRCIVSFRHVIQSFSGRFDRSLTQLAHELYPPHLSYTYAGGLTPTQFDQWLQKHIIIETGKDGTPVMTLRSGWRITMSDYGAFDTTIKEMALKLWNHFCNCLGIPLFDRRSEMKPYDPYQETSKDRTLLGWIRQVYSRPIGTTTGGTRVRGPYMNCSGRSDTAVLNVFLNQVTQYLCYLRVMTGHYGPYSEAEYEYVHSNMEYIALGDDSLVFANEKKMDGTIWTVQELQAAISFYGFEFSEVTVTSEPRNIVFLGQRPWFALQLAKERYAQDHGRPMPEGYAKKIEEELQTSVNTEFQFGVDYSVATDNRRSLYTRLWEQQHQSDYVERVVSWTPVLGRFMNKYGWRLDRSGDPYAWWKSINKAILASFPHLPIAAEIAQQAVKLLAQHTETPLKYVLKEERDRKYKIYYRPREQRVFLDYLGSEQLLSFHYGISSEHYAGLRRMAKEINTFPVLFIDAMLDLAQQREAS